LQTTKDLSFTLPHHKTRVSLQLQLITDEATQLTDTLEHLLQQAELLDQHLQRLWDLQYLRSSVGSHGDEDEGTELESQCAGFYGSARPPKQAKVHRRSKIIEYRTSQSLRMDTNEMLEETAKFGGKRIPKLQMVGEDI
jgi:hypothetical protein